MLIKIVLSCNVCVSLQGSFGGKFLTKQRTLNPKKIIVRNAKFTKGQPCLPQGFINFVVYVHVSTYLAKDFDCARIGIKVDAQISHNSTPCTSKLNIQATQAKNPPYTAKTNTHVACITRQIWSTVHNHLSLYAHQYSVPHTTIFTGIAQTAPNPRGCC